MLSQFVKLRKAEYLGGGFIEEMTIKPIAEAGFLCISLIYGTQTLYYKLKARLLEIPQSRCKSNNRYYKFYCRKIAPVKDKAASSELAFFASLVAVKRNFTTKFNSKNLIQEAKYYRQEFYRYTNFTKQLFSFSN